MGYTLIIDNYDSFTWNVYADIAVLGGNPLVKRNDKITIEEIQVRALLGRRPSLSSHRPLGRPFVIIRLLRDMREERTELTIGNVRPRRS
jgi:hypothetical protein